MQSIKLHVHLYNANIYIHILKHSMQIYKNLQYIIILTYYNIRYFYEISLTKYIIIFNIFQDNRNFIVIFLAIFSPYVLLVFIII